MAFNNNKTEPRDNPFVEKVVKVSRVSKKTEGGNQFGFSILVVVGDKKGQVGVGLGKGKDVLNSIKKGVKKAKKNLITVPMDGTTIPFPITLKQGAARIILKPAPKGSGVIAGGPIRAVVEAAGIRDLSAKILGTNNQASNVYATFTALKQMQTMVALKGITLKSIIEVEAEEEAKLKAEAEKEKAHHQEAAGKKPVPAKKAPQKVAKTAPKADKASPKAAAAPAKPAVKKA